MKLNAVFERFGYDANGEIEITFKTSRLYETTAKSLENGSNYVLELNQRKANRSLEQNALLWAIIHDIAEHRNGRANTDNEWQVYIEALQKAGAKYEIITCIPEAEELLKKASRAIVKVGSTEKNGKTFNAYKVFYGSSTMNKAEMAKLLDETINIAYQEGIDVMWQF